MEKIHFPIIYRETLSTTPEKIIIENKHRRALLIINRDASINVELRSDPILSGLTIQPNESYENRHYCQGEFWLVAASGTPTVHIEEDVVEYRRLER